jgi:uncharacterized membrane protein
MKKQTVIIVALVAIAAIATAFLYNKLPEQMASHWNAIGEVDGYMNKQSHTIFFFALMIGLPLFLLYVPKLDPKYQNIKSFEEQYHWFIVAMTIFFAALYAYTLSWSFGYKVSMNYFIIPAMSFLFFSVGFLLESTKSNYSIGIRTSWTLSSEKIWNETHVFAAKAFKYGSLILLVSMVFGDYGFLFFLVGILVMAFAPVLYSYLLYRKDQQKR